MESEIMEIAVDLGVKPEALRKWRERQSVPHRWRLAIVRELTRRGRDLPFDVLDEAEWRIE